MTLQLNQFGQQVVQGQLDLKGFGENVISCEIASAETATCVAGDPVKLEDSAGGVPKVLKATADTDAIFGFIVRNLKDASFIAGDRCEIAIRGSVMYMTASAAIARGAAVESVTATSKVKTWANTNVMAGIAMDKASGNNSLIRVYVDVPGNYISLVALPTMLPTVSGMLWVDVNRVDSYTADGSQIRPFKTLNAAITAANLLSNAVIMMLPGISLITTKPVITAPMTIQALTWHYIMNTNASLGTALIDIIPAAQSATSTIAFKNVSMYQYDLDQNIVHIDNATITKTLKVMFDNSGLEYSANWSGNAIHVTKTDSANAVQIQIFGRGVEKIDTISFVVNNVSDSVFASKIKLKNATGLAGLVTGTTNIAAVCEFQESEVPKILVTKSGDGHATQKVRLWNCWNYTDGAPAVAGEVAGSQTAVVYGAA
jgi:hypothetical protein